MLRLYVMQKLSNGLALFSILASSVFFPAVAQTAPQTINCNAVASSTKGSRLTYQITGADRANLSITIQQRDRNGAISTLLARAPLTPFEQVAPDADYSQLPFNGAFRGQANDGRGIYSFSGSQHGLYISLRPLNGRPQNLQVVHYLRAGQFVRSEPGSCTAA